MPTPPDAASRFAQRAARLGALTPTTTPAPAGGPGALAGRAADAWRRALAEGRAGAAPEHKVFEVGGASVPVFFPTPAWLAEALPALAVELACGQEELRAALGPWGAFTAESAGVAAAALEGVAEDLAGHGRAAKEHETVLASFTDELSRSYETLSLLYSIGSGLGDLATPSRFVRAATARLFEGSDFGCLAVRFHAVDPAMPDEVVSCVRDPSREAPFTRAVRGLPADAGAYAGSLRVRGPGNPISAAGRQALVQPLELDGTFLGFLVGADKGGQDPLLSSYDLQLFQATGSFLSAFLKTCRLFDDQARMFVGTVRALTASIDAKDKYTRGHSERVAWLAARLAAAVGLPEERVRRVHIAGLVHDVGKIGVPEAVLCKPGRLTDDEFAWIRRHPEIGHGILKDIPQLADILPGVLHHHERMDGRGYPSGLRGDAIPLMARIIAVADTFDALSSTRSYRSARPRPVVLEEIARSAGTQLDPAIAAALPGVDLAEFDRMLAEHATTAPAVSVAA